MTDTEAGPELATSERAGLTGGLLTIVFLAVVAIGVVAAWILGGDDDEAAEVGGSAPSFALTAFDGTEFDLAEHIETDGRPVLLNLWASWCTPCREEFPELSAYQDAHPELKVVGVAVQDQEDAARSFAEEMDPSFVVAWDSDDSIRDSYPTYGLPSTFVIDANGTVLDVVTRQLTADILESLSFES